MAISEEQFKQLKDAVRDLASHVSAALDEINAGLAAVADGNIQPENLSKIRSGLERTNSHIADVRLRLQNEG